MRRSSVVLAFGIVVGGTVACESHQGRSLAELDAAVRGLESNRAQWVRWESLRSLDQLQGFPPYYAVDAFPEKAECASNVQMTLNRLAQAGTQIDGWSYQTANEKGYRTEHVFYCLPVGVDPRMPHAQP